MRHCERIFVQLKDKIVVRAAVEISRAHLCDIENGRKGLSPSRAAVFAQKLGYSETLFVELALQDLVTREGLNLHVDVRKKQSRAES
jgi:hypothetical protein